MMCAHMREQLPHVIGTGRGDECRRAPEVPRCALDRRPEPTRDARFAPMIGMHPQALRMKHLHQHMTADNLFPVFDHHDRAFRWIEEWPKAFGFGPCELRPFGRREDATRHEVASISSAVTSNLNAIALAGFDAYATAYVIGVPLSARTTNVLPCTVPVVFPVTAAPLC